MVHARHHRWHRGLAALIVMHCVLLHPTSAQQLDADQHPPGLDWRQIATEQYRVIFPMEIEADAQRVACTLEHIHVPLTRSLDVHPGRLSLILSNQTSVANGYAALAPRHSVWYTTPPPHSLLGTGEWFDLLATHEMRHIAQFECYCTGFTRIASWLFGEAGWAVMAAVGPAWVEEGDAVVMETALTRAGRGRQPEFTQGMRALLHAGRRPSYYQTVLGTYNLHVPNAYEHGYLLTSHFRTRFGAEAWRDVLSATGAWSFVPGIFSIAMNNRTGVTAVELHEETLLELDSLWKTETATLHLTDARMLTPTDPVIWTNHLFPQQAADGSIIVQKWGMDDLYEFVRLRPDGTEESLGRAGALGDPMSVRGSLMAWHERHADLRWGARDHSVLRIMDLVTGTRRTLPSSAQRFSPAIAPAGDRIAAVEFGPDRRCAIVVLDAGDGRELARFAADTGDLFQTPDWSPDGRSIVAVRVHPRLGKTIIRIDVATGGRSDLLPLRHTEISLPRMAGTRVFFTSAQTGMDNILALDMESTRVYQVTSRPVAARNAAVSTSGDTLFFNDCRADGEAVAAMAIDPTQWRELGRVHPDCTLPESPASLHPYCTPVIAQEAGGPILDSIPMQTRTVHPVGAFDGLVNIHTWAVIPPLGDTPMTAGVWSTDIFRTLALHAGVEYDPQERVASAVVGASHAGLFPIIDIGGRYGMRASTYDDDQGGTHRYTWREESANLGLRVPLNFTQVVPTSLTLSAALRWTRITDLGRWTSWDEVPGVIMPVTWRVGFSSGYQWMREVVPRHAVQAVVHYAHMPFAGTDFRGHHAAITTWFFAPGLVRNHGAFLNAAWERQWGGGYHYARIMSFSRGYASRWFETLWKLSLNYAMPLLYPDLAVWGVLNVQRLKATAFLDWAHGTAGGKDARHRSMGVEMLMDCNLLAQPAVFSVGLRLTRTLTERTWSTELLLGLPFDVSGALGGLPSP